MISYFFLFVKFFYYDNFEKILLIFSITDDKKTIYNEILTFITLTPIILI